MILPSRCLCHNSFTDWFLVCSSRTLICCMLILYRFQSDCIYDAIQLPLRQRNFFLNKLCSHSRNLFPLSSSDAVSVASLYNFGIIPNKHASEQMSFRSFNLAIKGRGSNPVALWYSLIPLWLPSNNSVCSKIVVSWSYSRKDVFLIIIIVVLQMILYTIGHCPNIIMYLTEVGDVQ